MSTDSNSYLYLAIFTGVAMVFPLLPIGMAWLWAKIFYPAKETPVKRSTYECGLAPQNEVCSQYRPDFYLYGILFLIFDVEAIFLLPFGVAFLDLNAGSAIAMLVFILLLAESLVWAWKKGVLTWR
jgi:NADH:ubiquinone oxidoreductase subunit 3 (subunit A)